jgi:GntR family transcriptional repressor for pyruvate dehydrogenase complex
MLEPAARVSLTDVVLAQLKKLIVQGNLQAGDRIPTEKELCARLRVSRTALREAKQALVAMGILETSAGGGTFVRGDMLDLFAESIRWGLSLRPQDINDLVEARIVLETASAAYAADRATDQEKASLQRMMEELRTTLAQNRMDAYADADLALHTAIAEMAHNKMLLRVTLAIRGLLKEFIAASLSVPGSAASSMQAHELLIGAILNGRSAQARRLMEAHLEDVRDRILRMVTQIPDGQVNVG